MVGLFHHPRQHFPQPRSRSRVTIVSPRPKITVCLGVIINARLLPDCTGVCHRWSSRTSMTPTSDDTALFVAIHHLRPPHGLVPTDRIVDDRGIRQPRGPRLSPVLRSSGRARQPRSRPAPRKKNDESRPAAWRQAKKFDSINPPSCSPAPSAKEDISLPGRTRACPSERNLQNTILRDTAKKGSRLRFGVVQVSQGRPPVPRRPRVMHLRLNLPSSSDRLCMVVWKKTLSQGPGRRSGPPMTTPWGL